MRARKNPTNEQLMRRLRRPPESDRDPRVKNDPYWALRFQGYPHSYAKRAFRDQPPTVHERVVSIGTGECDPEDLLFSPGAILLEPDIAMRPELSDESVVALGPRQSEYTIWDHVILGFGMRVRASGHKSFTFTHRNQRTGQLRKYTLGKVGNLSLDQARDIARAYRSAALEEDEQEIG